MTAAALPSPAVLTPQQAVISLLVLLVLGFVSFAAVHEQDRSEPVRTVCRPYTLDFSPRDRPPLLTRRDRTGAYLMACELPPGSL